MFITCGLIELDVSNCVRLSSSRVNMVADSSTVENVGYSMLMGTKVSDDYRVDLDSTDH